MQTGKNLSVQLNIVLIFADVLNCRSNNQFFSSPDCKMKWFHRPTCRCYMLKQLHAIRNVHLWNSLMECIWIRGYLVVIDIGVQFWNSWKRLFHRRRMMNLLGPVSFRFPCISYSYFEPASFNLPCLPKGTSLFFVT